MRDQVRCKHSIELRYKGGEKGSYSSPTNLFSTQQPEAEAIKTTEIASMDTVAVIVWRDSNFNGPTGFLMSVVPQTK